MAYWDSNNLLNCNATEQGGDNSILFTVENYLLKQDPTVNLNLTFALTKMQIKPGLFLQNPTNKDYMSHDNLTAIQIFANLQVNQEIWKEVKRQWFRYDNLNPDSPSWNRILHPRDVIYYGILAGSPPCWLMFPFLALMMILGQFSTYEQNSAGVDIYTTSGKLLNLIRCEKMKHNVLFNLLLKILTSILKWNTAFKTWYGVYNIYFNYDQNHPNVILAKEKYENKNSGDDV